MDITSTFDSFMSMMLDGFHASFSILDNIQFHGISLLDFILWVGALGIILPILITLLGSGRSASESYYHRESRKAEAEGRKAEK